MPLGVSWDVTWEYPWMPLGASWGLLGGLGAPWGVLGASGSLLVTLEPAWVPLVGLVRLSWDSLRSSGGVLESILEDIDQRKGGAQFEPPSGATEIASWGRLEPPDQPIT